MSSATEKLLEKLVEQTDPFHQARFAGQYESAIQTTATAALIVRPSTLSAITFINRANPGGLSLVIDRIFTHNLVTTAVNGFFQLWYCMHPNDIVVIAVNSITTLRGKGDASGDDLGNVFVEVGRTVVNDGWFPAGETGEISATATTPGASSEWEAKGRLVVPPGASMSVQVVASVTGNTFTSGGAWWRTQL